MLNCKILEWYLIAIRSQFCFFFSGKYYQKIPHQHKSTSVSEKYFFCYLRSQLLPNIYYLVFTTKHFPVSSVSVHLLLIQEIRKPMRNCIPFPINKRIYSCASVWKCHLWRLWPLRLLSKVYFSYGFHVNSLVMHKLHAELYKTFTVRDWISLWEAN